MPAMVANRILGGEARLAAILCFPALIWEGGSNLAGQAAGVDELGILTLSKGNAGEW